MARPNLLLVMPDQLRAGALSCAGHPVFLTPHADRLAREGVHFTHMYATSPLCMPARVSMVSGTYPHNHHIQANAGTPPAADETFLHLLQGAGYRTAFIGKAHLYAHPVHGANDTQASAEGRPPTDLREHEGYMHARGFEDVHEITGPGATPSVESYLSAYWRSRGLYDRFCQDLERRKREGGPLAVWPSPLPEEEFIDSYVGARAVEWLEQYDDERPFCLWVGFPSPHDPWDAPGRYATRYDPAEMPAPLGAETPADPVPASARERMLSGRTAGLTDDAARRMMANYGGKVSLVDDWLGRLLDTLDARGLTENTLVVFWSDHGEMGADHERFGKRVFYELSVRVPFIMRWPAGLPAGVTTDALVEHIDLFDTLVDASGATPSRRSFGRSLLPHARGEAPPRDVAFSEFNREIMIRTDRFKYAIDAQGQGFLLHDLVTDPDEQRNLLGHPDYRTVEHDLRERILVWLTRTQVVAA